MDLPPYVEHIGRMAHFLIPISKIDQQLAGSTVRGKLYSHLNREFGGCTEDPLVWGRWGATCEAHVHITVSFKGKERVGPFLEFLAGLCAEIDEKCIYLEMGEESYLVYPIPVS